MLAAWGHQTTAAGGRNKTFFSRNSDRTLGSFLDKFEHSFGTQLGPVLLWRRVRSGGLMLAAWSYQTTAAGGRKKNIFLGI